MEGVEPTSPDWANESHEDYGYFYDAEHRETVATERGGYQHYFLQMAAAINNKTAPPVSAEDALWNIKLIELAMESSRLGQKLPIKNV
ncbi:Gfo/Idh/MocA family oxidoreductase [Vibrio natriegens]|uniref:Gfo/Idh/MocA family oxidoreductase n=1 Tax=Vibrio natriegens TaxID=691 RepID=UPI0034A0BF07